LTNWLFHSIPDDGSIYSYTEDPGDISGESVDEILECCQRIITCLDKSILVDGQVEFVDSQDELPSLISSMKYIDLLQHFSFVWWSLVLAADVLTTKRSHPTR